MNNETTQEQSPKLRRKPEPATMHIELLIRPAKCGRRFMNPKNLVVPNRIENCLVKTQLA